MGKKVTIQYEKDKDYRTLPCQGAWFGVAPNGDIVADLYVERPTPPTEVTIEVEPPNMVRELERVGEKNVRILMAGLVMRPDVAYMMGEWLQNKAKAAGFTPPEKH